MISFINMITFSNEFTLLCFVLMNFFIVISLDNSDSDSLDEKYKPDVDSADQDFDNYRIKDKIGPNNLSGESSDLDSEVNNALIEDIRDVPTNLQTMKKKLDSEEINKKKSKIIEYTDHVNQALGLNKQIKDITDKKAWRNLFENIKFNFDKYSFDGKLSIELHNRYFLCGYIIAFVPADFVFAFPKFIFSMIPTSNMKSGLLKDLLVEIKLFLKFSKAESSKKFTITFYVGRSNTIIEDLEFILQIPNLIFNDPSRILRELLAFEIRSEGYVDFKKKYKK